MSIYDKNEISRCCKTAILHTWDAVGVWFLYNLMKLAVVLLLAVTLNALKVDSDLSHGT